ncbi:MAG TPA: ABC transporter ATP-binding protein [Pricia antarctica]|uniref:ABC transporter ATP-binding protein n=3 Tax=root TaxID=1 RepID=A0A831VT82_9FLAO|nr:ABC transporter ATP-binding protein [Pricia antarctica]
MIQALNLTKRYGSHLALNKLNLQINPGEICCLLGQNGAGKSTTINLFLGFLEPTSGNTIINGINVQEHPQESKNHLAYIPETVMLYPNLSGIENLEYFSSLAGFEYSKKELGDFLLKTGLQEEAYSKRLGGYSKGMRQKVGIAIAISKNAKALFLDEPTSGLDPKASNEFTKIIKQLSESGTAILMATHDIFRAKQVADSIGILRSGDFVAQLRAADISANELEELYLKTV